MIDEADSTLALSTGESPSVSPVRPAPVDTPHQIGRYLVIRTLGSGAMGVVYSAYDEELDRRVAIKLLRTDLYGTIRTRGLSRMRREAQALAKLSHPNVVQVYDVGEFNNQLFLAMEYVRGRTLAEWRKATKPELREVVDIFLQAGRGLAAAHAAGLVHRDFKPDNVIVGDDGRVRVLDFGVARADASDDEVDPAAIYSSSSASVSFRAELTEAGMIIGTPAYMAPEQFLSLPTDGRTDIFGFSVALYEALYGRRPFRGAGVDELKAAVLAGEIVPPADERGVPVRIHRILLRGLQPDPFERYQTMDELLEELAYDPSVARRRALFIALAVLALAAMIAAAISLTTTTDTRPSCDAAASELSQVYNPERRARIGAGILRSSVPFAGSTWERVAPRLDDYAAAWSGARYDACEAHREGRQSPRLFDLRTACLDQRRAGFVALLEVFESADESTIPKLAEAVLALPRLEPCADTEALTSAIPPPEDEATADEVQRLRERLAEVKAYESVGKYQQAAGVIDALEAEAEALPYAPSKIEVLLRRGTLAMWQFQFEAADEALSKALYEGIAFGHEPAAADAISRLLYIRSVQNPLEAKRELRLGDALIRRVEGQSEIEATYYNNVGALYTAARAAEPARVALRRSLETKRSLYGGRHLEVGYSLSNLGSLEVDEGYYERSIEHFVEAVAIFQENLGPDHFQTGAVLSNLANAYARSGRWLDATDTYDDVDEIFRASPEVWSEIGPYILPDRGDFYSLKHELGAATADYERVLSFLGPEADAEMLPAIRARVGLAEVAAQRGALADVEGHLVPLRPLLASERPADSMLPVLADALDLEALLAGSTGGREMRFERHLRAFELRKSGTAKGSPNRSRAHLIFTRALLDLGESARAGEHLSQARQVIEELLPEDSPERITLERLSGERELDLGHGAESVEHFRFAVKLLQHSRVPEDLDLAITRFALARALMQGGMDRVESGELAALALETLSEKGTDWRDEAEEVAVWIRESVNG